MTNATKTLLTLFVVLVGTAIFIELNSGQAASRAFRTEIVKADTSRINRVEINTPDKEKPIVLLQENSSWKVKRKGGTTYPADETAVMRSLAKLSNLEVNALMTRDKEDYTRYKVDSTGTRVTLKQGDQVLDEVIIGAPQIKGRRQFNTYVRAVGQDEVFSVEGYLKPTFDKEVSGWRDKTVWEISDSKISRIDFVYPADSAYSIQRAGANKWVSKGDTLESTKVRSIINQLSTLVASGFVPKANKQQFGKEKFAIQIQLKSGEQRTVRFKEDTANTGNFRTVASGYPYVFTLNRSSWNDQVLKSREALLQ